MAFGLGDNREFRAACLNAANLLRLQSQLNKDLLQLLVDKVDAELLKAVPLPGGEKTVVVGSDPLSKYNVPLPAALLQILFWPLQFLWVQTRLTWNISNP